MRMAANSERASPLITRIRANKFALSGVFFHSLLLASSADKSALLPVRVHSGRFAVRIPMTALSSATKRPRLVGVIASRADLDRAVRMCEPPDLFELRLDCLAGVIDQLERKISGLRAPLIITARHPQEGG